MGIQFGGDGAFDDTDGDGVAELQEAHADMLGGDLRNAGAVGADEINNVVQVEPGDDLQAAIDSVDRTGQSWAVASGVVRLVPSTSETLNLFTLSGEYVVRENVTVDMRGAAVRWDDAGPHWTLRKQASILTHGSHQSVPGDGPIYNVESYDGGIAVTDAPEVLGFGRVENADQVVRIIEAGGGSVSNALAEVTTKNCSEVARFRSAGGGYVNDNVVRLRGSCNPGAATSGAGIYFLEDDPSTGDRVRENEVELQQVQLKGSGSGDFVKVAGGRFNDVHGTAADYGTVALAVRFTADAHDYNTFRPRWGYIRGTSPDGLMTDNSGATGNTIVPLDRPNIYPTPDLTAWYEVGIDNTGARTTTQNP